MSVLLIAFAFLCGSLPSGVWLARARGIDVRGAGSGNIGATNVTRVAGARLGLFTLLADVAKGFLAVGAALKVVGGEAVPACAAVAAVLGHVFSPFLRFAGGKGVSTALGASMALCPLAALEAVMAFAVMVLTTGWVSLGSIVGAIALPILVAVLGYPRTDLYATLTIGVLVVVRHRENVSRMLAGSEPRVLPKKQASPRN